MERPIHAAPYRVETDRLVLRCPEISDLRVIHDGVVETLPALRPWMPWVADEPVSLSERARVIQRLRSGFDRGEDFTYMMFRRDSGGYVGGAGLHARVGEGGVELGYWVRSSEQGRGLAGEAASGLLRTAFEHMGVDRVEIRIERDNRPSHRVVEKLGVSKEATLRRRFPRAGDLRDVNLFTVFRADFPACTAAGVAVSWLDAAGKPVHSRFPFPDGSPGASGSARRRSK